MKNNAEDRRSQKRIFASIPVEIRGRDASGELFEERTQASNVSRRGLCLLTRRAIRLHSQFTVVFPGLGLPREGRRPTDLFARAIAVSVRQDGPTRRVGMRLIGTTLTIYSSEGR
jgi:hypothetical protein